MISAMAFLMMCSMGAVAAGEATTKQDMPYLEAKPEELARWRAMRFGMFVCWGPVALTGKEIGWSRGGERRGRTGRGPTPVEVYDNLYKQWKPDKFDARAWVRLALDAGQRYMIFLVKHHDGFCLYDTKLTSYKSTSPDAAWRRDVMADVAAACHEAGLKLFIYYSQPDWHHPDYRTADHHRYIRYLHGQIRELLTNYGHIDGLWFDGLGGKAKDWDAETLFEMARTVQPHLMINNRCGLPGDFDTPEQRIGRFQTHRPWESCITLGTQWSWKPNDRIKSLKECIHTLVRCAGGDGNLALNTNPMPDGRIEPRQAERFREIGRWLGKYGESIYGTRGGPFKPGAWGVATHKGNVIYVHLLARQEGPVTLPAIPKKILAGRLLGGGTVTVSQNNEGVTVALPKQAEQGMDTIIELQLDGLASDIPPCGTPSGSVAAGRPIRASSVWPHPGYEADKAVDDDETTRWGAGRNARSGWLEVDLGRTVTVDRVRIQEAYDRVESFELHVKEAGAWRTCLSGTTIGPSFSKRFAPVSTRHVRLNIIKATDVPTIWEFQLFPVASK